MENLSEQKPQNKQIIEALIKAQKEIKHAKKDAQANHSTYATLSSVIDATKEALLKNDLVLVQKMSEKSLVTRISHKSGEFEEMKMDLIIGKNDMQGLGSAITYARRYSIVMMLNMSQEDDDANGSLKGKKSVVIKPVSNSKKDTHNF